VPFSPTAMANLLSGAVMPLKTSDEGVLFRIQIEDPAQASPMVKINKIRL